jgi:predicted  nucleic acid-binding Zn-ribbon protein
MSTQLIEKVDAILTKAEMPNRATFYQIQKFMIGKEPTGQSQLWAVVRELQARRETVDAFDKDLADAADKIELFDLKIERVDRLLRQESEKNEPFSDLNIKEYEIDIRRLQRERQSLIKSAQKANTNLKNILEEMNYLVKAHESIISQIGEMKPLDDEDAQKEMWNEKLLEEFNLRIILQRPMDPEFVKTVLCLHDEAPVKKHVVALVNQIQQKMLADRQTVQKLPPKKPQVEIKPRVTGG